MGMIACEISDGVAVLRMDAPPLNTLSLELLDALRGAVRRANDDAAVSAIVVTGRPDHFSAGADVGLFERIGGEADAVRISRVFQEAFGEIEASGKPVVAAVGGRMMGGALELAMACHARVCADDSRFSMPEVNLGFNPGAGGTQRLPRLIGPGPALKMLVAGEAIDAAEALRLGLVDGIAPADSLVERACALARGAGEPARTGCRADKVSDPAANAGAFAWAEEYLGGVRPELVAPREIAGAVRAGIERGFEAGLEGEQGAFARCMATRATRNKIYLFFATRQTAKIPELSGVKHGKIKRAAVVGAGSMGTGIAHALIMGGVPVSVIDENEGAVATAIGRITKSVEERVAKGKMAPGRAKGMLELIRAAEGWGALADADIVIEAVFEDVSAKRGVFARLEEVCREDAILATNTSTISLDALVQGMRRPERLVGMHFFNPAQRMPLVEVIRRSGTAPEAIAATIALARGIRKTPVLCDNREGFIVNRLFIPYLKEAFYLLEDGAEPEAIDAAMVDFGFPMGPLTLIDMAGIDILVATDRVMRQVFPRHGDLSAIATRLVEGGHFGQKAGAGVYKYEKGAYTPRSNEDTRRLVAEVRSGLNRMPRKVENDEIRERLVLRMVAEASYVLGEGVARGESDLDVATVLGIGFPDFRGGVMRHARDLGLDAVRRRLADLAARFGERFQPGEFANQN
ncbi:MAG: enoyl-CoA hydratase/isomerase family protein [Verrucomicrobiae bacterium]|nr:enoyl-CoA hydratase/isomerase family protein [Verrucomicrobiae bacterium]